MAAVGGTDYFVRKLQSGVSVAGPSVTWSDLDLGARGVKKHWRRARILTNLSYVGAPTLTYAVGGAAGFSYSGTLTGEVAGSTWVFTLPSGIVGEEATLTVTLVNAVVGDTLLAPVEIEAELRYQRA